MNRLIEALSDPGLLDGIDRNEIPELLGMLETFKVLLTVRLGAPSENGIESSNDRLLRVEEAAETVSLKPEHVHELIRQKRFPSVRIGKYVRVDPADLPA